jgi:hypothetical protein
MDAAGVSPRTRHTLDRAQNARPTSVHTQYQSEELDSGPQHRRTRSTRRTRRAWKNQATARPAEPAETLHEADPKAQTRCLVSFVFRICFVARAAARRRSRHLCVLGGRCVQRLLRVFVFS